MWIGSWFWWSICQYISIYGFMFHKIYNYIICTYRKPHDNLKGMFCKWFIHWLFRKFYPFRYVWLSLSILYLLCWVELLILFHFMLCMGMCSVGMKKSFKYNCIDVYNWWTMSICIRINFNEKIRSKLSTSKLETFFVPGSMSHSHYCKK